MKTEKEIREYMKRLQHDREKVESLHLQPAIFDAKIRVLIWVLSDENSP